MLRPNAAGLIVLLAAVLAGSAWARPAREATIHDDLARQLQRAVSVPASRAERQFVALAALRQLRDARLQPLFADLAARPRADLRAEGILGLAELADDGNVSLAMVGEIKNPSEQSLVILEALAGGRLSASQAAEVLSWPKLDPRLELALRARAVSGLAKAEATKASDADRLRALAATDSPLVQVLAETLLSHAGDGDAAGRLSSILSKLPDDQRSELMGPALEMISREKLLGAAPVIAALMPLCSTDGQRAAAASTLMRVDSAAGSEAWLKQWNGAKELAGQIRLALAASECADQAPPTVADALAKSNVEPPAGIGRAIASLRAGPSGASPGDPAAAAQAFVALISQGHTQSTAWAMNRAQTLPDEAARGVFLGVIRHAISDRTVGKNVPRAVFEAGWRLAQRDAGALSEILARACAEKDAPLAEALLAGLIRGGAAPAWDHAKPPAFPGLTAQSMALLYRARLAGIKPADAAKEQSEPTNPVDVTAQRGPLSSGGGFDPTSEDAEMLRQVALGRGNLPEAYRVIAAWLALCQDGKDREALARLLAPEPE
ncbi:MAG: hypothetical protein ACKVZJ_13565 [Phycisphaerales bacterium]